jgi:hypothetical protein
MPRSNDNVTLVAMRVAGLCDSGQEWDCLALGKPEPFDIADHDSRPWLPDLALATRGA